MYYITTPTATEDNEFTDGDSSQSIPPTDLNADWFNMIQRELLSILTGAGVTPSEAAFDQIWNILKNIGVRNVNSDAASVAVSKMGGASAIFHSASSFTISNLLPVDSLVIIVPSWTSNSSDTIQVFYNSQTVTIRKWQIFVGYISSQQRIGGFFVPVVNNVAGGELTVGGLVAGYIKPSATFDNNIVSFAYSGDNVGDASSWQAWQLASEWNRGQVKKVYCTDAASSGQPVPVFHDETSSYKTIKFYPEGYREFTCVGTRVSGDLTFAILLVNGGAN